MEINFVLYITCETNPAEVVVNFPFLLGLHVLPLFNYSVFLISQRRPSSLGPRLRRCDRPAQLISL